MTTATLGTREQVATRLFQQYAKQLLQVVGPLASDGDGDSTTTIRKAIPNISGSDLELMVNYYPIWHQGFVTGFNNVEG